jgi:hypothetical protein
MPMVLFRNLDPLTSIFAQYLGPFMRKMHFVHRPIFVRNLGVSPESQTHRSLTPLVARQDILLAGRKSFVFSYIREFAPLHPGGR